MPDQIKYRSLEKYKYQLQEDTFFRTVIRPRRDIDTEFISLDRCGILEIKQGYAWNGANKPAWNNKTIRRGSLAHDALYQLMGLGLLPLGYREAADQLLLEICLADGMWPVRAWWVYRAVRLGGEAAAKSPSKLEIEYAP